MKIEVEDLIGIDLDAAVAMAEGYDIEAGAPILNVHIGTHGTLTLEDYHPSRVWEQGGPILEREGISVWRSLYPEEGLWCAAPCEYTTTTLDEFEQRVDDDDMQSPIHGPTPLIAAMRCYVASNLGEEVEIPEEVLK